MTDQALNTNRSKPETLADSPLFLVDVSDIFYFFCSGGGGRGSARRRAGGGIDVLSKIPGGGGGVLQDGGAEGPGGCLRRIGEKWGGEGG